MIRTDNEYDSVSKTKYKTPWQLLDVAAAFVFFFQTKTIFNKYRKLLVQLEM